MNASGTQILYNLERVSEERSRRALDTVLGKAVARVKAFQHQRFATTYSDLTAHSRYRDATQFFLEDIYGPGDFSQRDTQFARVVPALVRLFPGEIVETVAELTELHGLSEQLDTAMGQRLGSSSLDGSKYGDLWRSVGDPQARFRQIELIVSVGRALDNYTRKTLLRQTLRLMRRPAQAAGLGSLQAFLERGFDTFRAMRGATEFLDLIATRERGLAELLFDGGSVDVLT